MDKFLNNLLPARAESLLRKKVKKEWHAPKYTVAEVAEALTRANGVMALAAQALKCSRSTVYNYYNRHKEVREAAEQAGETVVDLAESKLIGAVRDGNLKAVIFVLKTKGKPRGYVERQEVTGADGNAQKIEVEYINSPIAASPISPKPTEDPQ